MDAGTQEMIRQEFARPSAVYRPKLLIDGNRCCALYGDDLVEGIGGFGATPAAAMADLDHQWLTRTPPREADPTP